MLTERPTYKKADYGYASSYKAENVPQEYRELYHKYNRIKGEANMWLSKNDIPLMLRFRPNSEFKEIGIWTNMILSVSYVLPDHSLYVIKESGVSKNEVKIEYQWSELAKHALKAWDTYYYQDKILAIANKIQEVEDAYEQAYALS